MEEEDKELNSQNQKQGTCLVKFRRNGMLEKTVDTAPPPEKESHWCKECGKSFSCGKALGGHLSSAHVQSKKDYSFDKVKFSGQRGCNSVGSPAGKGCVICGREFPSSKALFGHMRSHPERQWRGMDPPPVECSDDDHDGSSSSTTSEGAPQPQPPVAGMASSLKGWSITAKRGRPGISKPLPLPLPPPQPQLVTDRDVTDSFQKLVEFVENHSAKQDDKVEDVGSSSLDDDSHKIKKQKTESAIDVAEEKLTEAETEEAESKAEEERTIQENSGTAEAERTIQQNSGSSSTRQNHVCTTCNRIFPTHQALGGHKSSHNKFKISIINTIDEASNENNNHNNGSRRQPGSFICKICDMSFSSGQALGRHKRSHKEDETKKNETAPGDFEIDLNKLPDEEV